MVIVAAEALLMPFGAMPEAMTVSAKRQISSMLARMMPVLLTEPGAGVVDSAVVLIIGILGLVGDYVIGGFEVLLWLPCIVALPIRLVLLLGVG